MLSFLILISFFCTLNKCENNSYHLKWVTEETKFPIIFSYNTSQPSKYSWYKLFEKDYTENLNKDVYKSEIDETTGMNFLKIYDYNSNQLDHYRLKPNNEENHDEIIFTIGFVKHFHIAVTRFSMHSNTTCFVSVILPIGLNKRHMEFLQDSIQERIDLQSHFDNSFYDYDSLIFDYAEDVQDNGKKRFKRSRFDRFVYEVQINAPSVLVYGTERQVQNITCQLSLVDFDNMNYKKTIFKALGPSNAAFKFQLYQQSFFILLLFFACIFVE